MSQPHSASFSPSTAGSRRQLVTRCGPGPFTSIIHPPHHLPRVQISPPSLHKPFHGSPELLRNKPDSEHKRPFDYPLASRCLLLTLPQRHQLTPAMLLLHRAPGTLHVLIPLPGIYSPPPSHTQMSLSTSKSFIIQALPSTSPFPSMGSGTPSLGCHITGY